MYLFFIVELLYKCTGSLCTVSRRQPMNLTTVSTTVHCIPEWLVPHPTSQNDWCHIPHPRKTQTSTTLLWKPKNLQDRIFLFLLSHLMCRCIRYSEMCVSIVQVQCHWCTVSGWTVSHDLSIVWCKTGEKTNRKFPFWCESSSSSQYGALCIQKWLRW